MRNREKSVRLLEGIGEIRDEIIESAAALKDGKQYNLHILVALITLGDHHAYCMRDGEFCRGDGRQCIGIPVNYNGNVYQSYRGPVFPLTAAGRSAGLRQSGTLPWIFRPMKPRKPLWRTAQIQHQRRSGNHYRYLYPEK